MDCVVDLWQGPVALIIDDVILKLFAVHVVVFFWVALKKLLVKWLGVLLRQQEGLFLCLLLPVLYRTFL